jgi:hypothetical protein
VTIKISPPAGGLIFMPYQKSLAEFAARRRQINFNPFFAAACTSQKTLLGLQVWNLFAFSEQIMRAADCKPFVQKGLCPFWTVSRHPARGVVSFHLNTFLYTKQLKIYIKLTLKNCRILPLARSKSEVYSMECNFSADNFTKPMRTPEKVNFFRV